MVNGGTEQAVIVHMKLSDGTFGTPTEREAALALEDRLEDVIGQATGGEYDGHEFGEGWCKFYMYGDNAEMLANVIAEPLRSMEFLEGSFLVQRVGPPGSPETTTKL